MHILIGILLILSLSFMAAPTTADGKPVRGAVAVVTGTEGTKIGLQIQSDGNPRVSLRIGEVIPHTED